jgi:hypothetical protein
MQRDQTQSESIGNNRNRSETDDERTVDEKKDRKGYAKGNYDQQLIQILRCNLGYGKN